MKKTEIISVWIQNVSGLAVDWLTGNLYWSDSGYRRIMVSGENGSFPSVLHHSNLVQPEHLVIISTLRYMFWSDSHYNNFRIERSNLDGRNRIILVGSTLLKRNLKMLTMDTRRNLLYWASENDVCCSSFQKDVSVKCFSFEGSVKSLDVMHDYLILADTNGDLKVANINNEVAAEHSHSPKFYKGMNFSDVCYYHVSKQMEEKDPRRITSVSSKPERKRSRKRHSQKCSQLCLPSGQSSRCACMTGVVVDYFWLFCDLQTGQIFCQFALLPDYYLFATPGNFHVVDVTLDNILKRLYLVDAKSNIIYSQFLNGTQQRVNFIGNENFNVTKVKVAPQSGLLYIISTNGDVILLSLLTGYFRLFLQLSTWAIRHIDVDEHNMLIYMTAVSKPMTDDNNVKLRAVLCSHMDGTNLRNMYVYDGSPLGIYVHNGNVFWFDPMKQFILNGKVLDKGLQVQPFVYLTGDACPENIFVKNDEVYFTDRSKQSLQRFTLNNSASISIAGFPYMNRTSGLNYFDSSYVNEPFQQTLFDKIWVPKPENKSICMCRNESNYLLETNKQCFDIANHLQKVASYLGICMVQSLTNGKVQDAEVGSFVPPGGTVSVSCDPGYVLEEKQKKNETRKCYQGQWTSADQCVSAISYKVHGNGSQGYVIFKDSATFFVPHGVFYVDVVCIGGGWGGFDACNKTIFGNESQAGSGGPSSFGKYLRAQGGLGGKINKGGRGGIGKTLFGGDGLLSHDCQGGGVAGQTEPPDNCMLSQTACLFCGAGGAMPQCSNCFSRGGGCGGLGSKKGQDDAADDYGGGATGLSGGSSGGGGGYSRGMLRVSPQQEIHVKVGKGGTPSAKPAGNGIVVVEWGQRLQKLIYSEQEKSTKPCKPIIFEPFDKEAILRCNSTSV